MRQTPFAEMLTIGIGQKTVSICIFYFHVFLLIDDFLETSSDDTVIFFAPSRDKLALSLPMSSGHYHHTWPYPEQAATSDSYNGRTVSTNNP